MKNKKIPMRTCVVSKEKFEKKDLIRIVRTPEGKVLVDTTSKLNGRGCYLKKDKTVIEKAKNSGILNKYLEVDIPNEIYEELINIIN